MGSFLGRALAPWQWLSAFALTCQLWASRAGTAQQKPLCPPPPTQYPVTHLFHVSLGSLPLRGLCLRCPFYPGCPVGFSFALLANVPFLRSLVILYLGQNCVCVCGGGWCGFYLLTGPDSYIAQKSPRQSLSWTGASSWLSGLAEESQCECRVPLPPRYLPELSASFLLRDPSLGSAYVPGTQRPGPWSPSGSPADLTALPPRGTRL